MICWIAGHTPLTPGAPAVDDGGRALYHEHDAARVLARQLEDRGQMALIHEPRRRDGSPATTAQEQSYGATVGHSVRIANAAGADLLVELHFNSVPEHFNTGAGPLPARDWDRALALHWPSSARGRSAGRALVEACAAAMPGVEEGGTYGRTTSWAGAPLIVLGQSSMPAVILEVCNGRNPRHAEALIDGLRGGLADALAEAASGVVAAWHRAG